jgi:hypothetical protein
MQVNIPVQGLGHIACAVKKQRPDSATRIIRTFELIATVVAK